METKRSFFDRLRQRVIAGGEQPTRTVALAGNPNVGKSTLFNALTGLHQRTGNWTGITVDGATGLCRVDDTVLRLMDIPGTYSLSSASPDEAIARSAIAFGGADTVCVVCSATCLERGLVLVFQIMELCPSVVVCLNLWDEAKRRRMVLDEAELSRLLGVPVIKTSARRKPTVRALGRLLSNPPAGAPAPTRYHAAVEAELRRLCEQIHPLNNSGLPDRFLAIQVLADERVFLEEIRDRTGCDLRTVDRASALLSLGVHGMDEAAVKKELALRKYKRAEQICRRVIAKPGSGDGSLKADRIVTGKLTGIPLMLALLLLVFWITIYGAQAPSEWLSNGLFALQEPFARLLTAIRCPAVVVDLLVYGVYRVLAWVVSVMLPPMAIFFPLFTLLEDLGILPRVAFNMDHGFHKCRACGKQALTMCMGFGCNAAGVIGCRIIGSRRERLIAILTNALVPCNGRFPTLIAMITLFFVTAGGAAASLLSAGMLTLVIALGVAVTLLASYLLSHTVLRGEPSFFSLELPPYRLPKVGQVLVRSLLDRTVFVLGRSAMVAAPAGLVIWLLAHWQIGGQPLLWHLSEFLDPLGRIMGMDGVILLAFILGMPANEIVIPIMLMTYSGSGILTDYASLADLKLMLLQHGWTRGTALCVILFMLFHWPCSTTLLTVYKETRSLRYTLLAAALPTAVGMLLCMGVHLLVG